MNEFKINDETIISELKKLLIESAKEKDLAKEKILKLYKKETVVKNIINNNLYNSAVEAKIEPNIIIEFARIFGFEVDFQRDIRKGDWFEIYYEKFEDDSVFDDAVKRGSYILAYSKTVVKKVCDKASKRKFGEHDVMVVNSSHWMSEIGANLAKDCDFAMIWYYDHDDKHYRCSLRAFHDTIDVSEISKKFGGGGHRKAAGFVLPPTTHPDSIFDVPKKPSRRKRKAPVKKTVPKKEIKTFHLLLHCVLVCHWGCAHANISGRTRTMRHET